MMWRLRRFQNWRPVLAYSAYHYSEGFIVSAFVTVVGIRFFLSLTGFPQLGGDGLHIAHMLWGGLLMLVALIILINFLGDRPRAFAAICGGIGFGFFIDELGKFITNDNNYFFKPTALLIYTLFICLWFLFRLVEARRNRSQKAYFGNILELLQEGLLYGFNTYEKNQLRYYLSCLEKDNPLTPTLVTLSQQVEETSTSDQLGFYIRTSAYVNELYIKFINWRYFYYFLYMVLALQIVLSIVGLGDFLKDLFSSHQTLDWQQEVGRARIGQLSGATLYALMVAYGGWQLTKSRINGYAIIKDALLINLFITQFFAFYNKAFAAVPGLFFNLFLLGVINLLIEQEHRHRRKRQAL